MFDDTESVTDTMAMDAVAELMSGATWNPDLLDAIAEWVRASGRTIAEPL